MRSGPKTRRETVSTAARLASRLLRASSGSRGQSLSQAVTILVSAVVVTLRPISRATCLAMRLQSATEILRSATSTEALPMRSRSARISAAVEGWWSGTISTMAQSVVCVADPPAPAGLSKPLDCKSEKSRGSPAMAIVVRRGACRPGGT